MPNPHPQKRIAELRIEPTGAATVGIGAIFLVTENSMPGVQTMNAELVGSTGMQLRCQQAGTRRTLDHFEGRQACLTLVADLHPPLAARRDKFVQGGIYPFKRLGPLPTGYESVAFVERS